MPSQNPAHTSRTLSRPTTVSALPKVKRTSSERWRANASGSIESMSLKRSACLDIGEDYGGDAAMPNPGTINGSHHLTFCVGGAQEDYDFHVRTLGLKSVKKTVLFDGEIPIYHLYYANRVGDASTILTSFPYRQAGWMGKRGTNQAKSINVAVPAESIGYWSDRLNNAGLAVNHVERFGTERLEFAHPCGIPYQIVGETREDTREPYGGGDVPAEHAIRGAYGTTTSVREAGPMDQFLRDAFNAEQIGSDGAHHQYKLTGDGHGQILELVEEPDLPQGTWHF